VTVYPHHGGRYRLVITVAYSCQSGLVIMMASELN